MEGERRVSVKQAVRPYFGFISAFALTHLLPIALRIFASIFDGFEAFIRTTLFTRTPLIASAERCCLHFAYEWIALF